VLGGGAWGTALADHLARGGTDVVLWARDAAVVAEINDTHQSSGFLPGHGLTRFLRATSDLAAATRDAAVVLNSVPSHATRSVLEAASAGIPPSATLVNSSKGIELGTLTFLSGVVQAVLPGRPYVMLSGPSFAEEVASRQPTAVVAASLDAASAEQVQALFSSPYFRVYTSDDVTGVEVGGALKNVIAIAAGVLDGMGLGHNPRAALVTRGLAEMTRLGVALGAEERTFAGLAGLGDLILTCTGGLSRNRSLGVALGQGQSLADWTAAHRSAVEGVNTARAALTLAQNAGVELPITAQVAAVLFDGKPVRQAVSDLMERALKSEQPA
jgi:glycerol-3-phosphate dehydrogenase (NAD(P)+)